MPREITKLLTDLQARRDDESRAMQALLRRIETLGDDLEAAHQRLDTAAELLGECMAVVAPDTQETIAEAVAAWPADTLRHFHESERGARAAEASGANAKLRRAS